MVLEQFLLQTNKYNPVKDSLFVQKPQQSHEEISIIRSVLTKYFSFSESWGGGKESVFEFSLGKITISENLV
jgi:hypothetical protein